MTSISFTLDDTQAKQFNEVYTQLGINPQEALKVFARRSISSRGFPFKMNKRIFERIKDKIQARKFHNAFYSLRKQAQESGLSFSEEDIENIIAEVRAEG